MNRSKNIDVIKGIAIILMVYGHTFGLARDFIYLFHMPIFILVSGYCFSSKHAESFKTAECYFFTRVRRLLIPYMGFNIVYTICNNLFIKWNLYTNNPEFMMLVVPIQKAAQGLTEPMPAKEIVLAVYRVLRFDYIPQMGSASWFIQVLFIVCIVHCFVNVIINKVDNPWVRGTLWGIIFVVMLAATYLVSNGLAADANIARRHLQFFEVYTCYLIGIGLKKLDVNRFIPANKVVRLIIAVVAGIILYYMLPFGTLEMSKCYVVNIPFLLAVTLLGYLMLDSVAGIVSATWIEKTLVYIGEHTIPILFLHILAFKLVSLLYIKATAQPIYMLASWPVLFDVSEIIKIAYTVVGVAAPLAIVAGINVVKKSLRK